MTTIGNGFGRLQVAWRLKAALTLGLTLFFCAGYFGLQQVRFFPPHPLGFWWPDRWAGFDPGWVWVYQSIYLLLPVAPWLAASEEELRRYARGFVGLSLASFAVFVLFPVESPRPMERVEGNAIYNLLTSYEGRLNAFPSLHAGLIAYAVLFGERISRGWPSRGARRGLLAGMTLWGAAILYAALAVKQHYFVDFPAGAALAWASHRIAWRPSGERDVFSRVTG